MCTFLLGDKIYLMLVYLLLYGYVQMTQDPSLTSDGPRTPISPFAKVGLSKAVDKEKKIGHRRIGEGGEVTYKKVCSHIFLSVPSLMLQCLKLGSHISNYGLYSVGYQ